MTMRNRVLCIFSILVVLTAVVSLIGINALDKAKQETTAVREGVMPRIRLAYQIQNTADSIKAAFSNLLHEMRHQNKMGAETLRNELDRLMDNNDYLSAYKEIAVIKEAPGKLREAIRERREIQKRALEMAAQGDVNGAYHLYSSEGGKRQSEIDDICGEIVAFNQKLADEDISRLIAASQRAYWLMIAMAILALGVGLVSAWMIHTTINRTVADIRNSIAEIHTAAQQQVSAAQQQSTAMTENTSTLTEIRETGRESADRSKSVGEAAVQAAKRAQEGHRLSADLIGQADTTRTKIERMAESLLTLSDQVQRIGDIVVSVNEISEQTKILALNASIEAAKAGEEGKGFAVVATQIRDLANQSKEAGRRINTVITDIQKAARESVRDAQEGTKVSVEAMEAMKKLGDSFQEIVTTIEEVSQQVVQVATGSRQQESGINQITTAMAQIDSGMKESLASAQQTLKSISRIGEQIKTLGPAGNSKNGK